MARVLTRTFAEGWNTLVLPFSLSTDEVNAAFGEETEVAYFTNSAENAVELNLGENGEKNVTANQPVLIKPSKKGFVNFTFANKTIQNVANPTLEGENGIRFVGSYGASRKVAEGEYFIGDDKLWKSAGQTTLRGTRAYFAAPAAKAGSNIFLVWGGEDEPTGIKGADIPAAPAVAAPVYNLYGQKMGTSIDNLPSGIYIVNGKKIKK